MNLDNIYSLTTNDDDKNADNDDHDEEDMVCLVLLWMSVMDSIGISESQFFVKRSSH